LVILLHRRPAPGLRAEGPFVFRGITGCPVGGPIVKALTTLLYPIHTRSCGLPTALPFTVVLKLMINAKNSIV